MPTNITKIMLAFPVIVLVTSIFYIWNGGTIHSDLAFVLICSFFAIVVTLLNVAFAISRNMNLELIKIINHQEEMTNNDEEEEIFATLENVDDLQEFLKDLESDILKNIAARKERK